MSFALNDWINELYPGYLPSFDNDIHDAVQGPCDMFVQKSGFRDALSLRYICIGVGSKFEV